MASLVTTTVTGTLTTTDDIILTGTRAVKNTTSGGILTLQGGASWPGGKITLGGGNAAGGDIALFTGLSTETPTQRLYISAGGQASFSGNVALADDKLLKFGASDDLTIQHHNSGYGHLQNTGTLYLDCEVLSIRTDNSGITERVSISAAGATVLSGTTLNLNYGSVTTSGTLNLTRLSGDAQIFLTGSGANNSTVDFNNATTGDLADIYANNAKSLIFRTNGAVTALTLDGSQNATFAGGLNATGDVVITGKYLSSVDGERLQIGSTANGRGAVVGSKVYLPGGTTSNLDYSAYWAYDAYFDNSTRTWKSMRTTLGRKWKMEAGYHIAQMKFSFSSASDPISWSDLLILDNTGAIQFNSYGSGTHTGTSAYKLSVDSSGNIIETSIGAGAVDGSGTAGYISKWTDSDTIGNSIIYASATSVGISSVAFNSPAGTLHTQAVGVNTTYLDAYSTTNGNHSAINFRKSDSDTAGTQTQTDSGDGLGGLGFYGVNTGGGWGVGAGILVSQDGVSGGTYVPAHMAFATCTASAYGERMRIASDGNVGINCSNNLPAKLNIVSAGTDGVAILGMSESDQANIEFGFFGNFLGSGETANSLYIGSANGGSWLANIMEWRGDGRTTLNGPTITALTTAAGSGALLAPSGSTNILNKRTKELFSFSYGPGSYNVGGTPKNVADEENRTTTGSWTSYGFQVRAESKIAWLKVDCLTKYRVTSFAVSSYPGGAHKPGGDWVVQGSNDDSSWTTLGTGNYRQWKPYGFTGSDYTGTYPFDPQQIVRCTTVGDYRYFRIYADNFSDSGTNNYLLVMNWGLFVGGTQQDTFQRPIETSKPIRMAAGSYLIGEPTNGVRLNNSADTVNLIVAKNDGDVHMPGRLAIGGTTHVAGKWLTVIGPSSFSDALSGTSASFSTTLNVSGLMTAGLGHFQNSSHTIVTIKAHTSGNKYSMLQMTSNGTQDNYIRADVGDLIIDGSHTSVNITKALVVSGTSTFSDDLYITTDQNIHWSGNYSFITGNGANSSGYLKFYTSDTLRLTIAGDGEATFAGALTGTSATFNGTVIVDHPGTAGTAAFAINNGNGVMATFYQNDYITMGGPTGNSLVCETNGNTTLTGALTGTSATFSGMIHAAKSVSAGETVGLFIENTAASAVGNKAVLAFGTDAGATSTNNPRIEVENVNASNGASKMVFKTHASGGNITEAFRLNSDASATFSGKLTGTLATFSGNLGIGIANPGTYALNVNGTIYSSGTVTIANNKYYAGLNTSGAMYALLKLNASNQMEIGATNMAAAGYPARVLAKYITFEPAGTLGAPVETMRVTNGSFNGVGSVGIGTTAPGAKLHVYNTATTSDGDGSATETLSGQDSILLYGHDGTNGQTYGSITWTGGATRRRAMIAAVAESTDQDFVGLAFYTRGTDGPGDFFESMRIAHSGNVGIGTTAPTQLLEIYKAGNDTQMLVQAYGGTDNSTQAGVWFRTDNSSAGSYARSKGAVIFQRTGSYGVGNLYLCVQSNANSSSAAVGDAKLTIIQDGNVGIGTTAPAAKLHIHKDSGQALRLVRGATDGIVLHFYRGASVAGNVSVRTSGMALGGGSSEDDIFIDTAGKVGINDITPSYQLDVNGTFRCTGTAATGALTCSTIQTSSTIGAGGGLSGTSATFSGVVSMGNNSKLSATNSTFWLNGTSDIYLYAQQSSALFAVKTWNGSTQATRFQISGAGATATTAITGNATVSGTLGVTGTGSVGIGTTNPTRQLDLYGATGNALMSIRAGTTAAGGIFFYDGGTEMFDLQYKNSDDKFYLTSSASDSTGIIIQRADGNVGIGDTTPNYKLDVNGTFRVTGVSILAGIGGNLLPSVDSSYSLGDNTTRWAYLFADTIYGGGANITSLSGSNISSGTVAAARLGSGSSITSKFLRGDNTWQTVSSGSGDITGVTAGTTLSGGGTSGSVTINHANHTGEVTGSGSLTIAGNVVDEANLKVSNAPTNGYVLTARSGNTGGMTWEAASSGGGGMTDWKAVDGDGSSVTISNGKYLKFKEGTGIDVNLTDTSPGTVGDPYDMTIKVVSSVLMSIQDTNYNYCTPSSNTAGFYQGGSITVVASGSGVTFSDSTSSDYRLKSNISTFNSEAWTKVKSVNLRRFDFNESLIDPNSSAIIDRVGFIAHELAEAGIEGAVEGTKDEVDSDGNPVYQKVCLVKLVPVMWGALKEATARIETLETKVQALENS